MRIVTIGLLLWMTIPAMISAARADGDRKEAVIAGDYFGAGGAFSTSNSVAGDAFVAGGQVALRAPVEGDAVLWGGHVTVADKVGGNLYAGGGDVVIDAPVAHNARLAGGRVEVTRRGAIQGKATIAASSVSVTGQVGRQLTVFASSVALDGEVAGNVTVAAQDLTVGPNARIVGKLSYHGPRAPNVSPQAVISGGVAQTPYEFDLQRVQPWARAVAWIGLIAFTGGLFLIGALAILIAPQASGAAGRALRGRPLASFGLGFALAVCVPIAAVMLMFTLIGIPLGFALLFAWPATMLLGYLSGVMAVGDALAAAVSRAKGEAGRAWRILGLAVALVILVLLAAVPFVGWIIVTLLLFAGTGAMFFGLFGSRTA
ncbi:MAG TPA: hypothetical protein VFB20_08125 [Burkholderiales bacterium]|nr:hypothetical protein [Burkholderiales bacterium]